jgi:hypothetical protein
MPKAHSLVLLKGAGYQLHPALGPVNGNITEDHNILAILRLKIQGEGAAFEKNAGDGRALVLQGEVPVSRPVMNVVGYLASCPEVMQAGIILQTVCYPLIQVGDCKYLGQGNGFLSGLIFKDYSCAERK